MPGQGLAPGQVPGMGGTTTTSTPQQKKTGVYAYPTYENTDYANFDYTTDPVDQTITTPGGGGSRGGGGGVKPLSQEAFNAMLASINRKGPQYQFDPWNPQPYQGMPISPFDDTLYRQAETAMGQGYDQAGQQIGQGTEYARGALDRNWQNYGNLRSLAQPTMSTKQRGDLMSIGGGGGAAREVNAENVNSDQAFNRFLGANELVQSQAQGSRMNELELANQFYMNELAKKRLADETGLGIAETRGKQDWQQRADDRSYADNMIGQQWGRDASQYNNQGANQTGQMNTTQSWSNLQQTLGPLLELIMGANQSGLPIDLKQLGLGG